MLVLGGMGRGQLRRPDNKRADNRCAHHAGAYDCCTHNVGSYDQAIAHALSSTLDTGTTNTRADVLPVCGGDVLGIVVHLQRRLDGHAMRPVRFWVLRIELHGL